MFRKLIRFPAVWFLVGPVTVLSHNGGGSVALVLLFLHRVKTPKFFSLGMQLVGR